MADELSALGAVIKTAYQAQALAFTDAKDAKLTAIEVGATLNASNAFLVARENHTGVMTSTGISDFNTATRAQVEAELAAGSNISITASGTGATRVLTIAAAGGGGVADGDKGDLTVSAAGTVYTIDAGAITLAKQANVATSSIMGRVTVGVGSQEALTTAQATTLIDTFSSGFKGLVPASGGGTANFLRADGTFSAPAAGTGSTDARLAVHNLTGATLALGTPVYISGFNATTLEAQITTADSDGTGTMPVAGLVLASLATATSGFIVLAGPIVGVNTSTFALNDPIYVSTTGTLTNIAPIAGLVQEIARVTRVNAAGSILVGIQAAGTPIIDGASQLDVNGNKVLQYGVTVSAVNVIEVRNSVAASKPKIMAKGTDTNIGLHLQGKGTGQVSGVLQAIPIAVGDETTALTVGTGKVTFRMPFAFTLLSVRASVTTAATGASLLTINIKEGGVSIFSTKPTLNATSKTTVGATTASVLSDASLADDAEITIDIDVVGSTIAGAGLKVYLIGYVSE